MRYLATRDDFKKGNGDLSKLEDLKNDLKVKENLLGKVKKSLVGVVGGMPRL